jgi:hypothetical protein
MRILSQFRPLLLSLACWFALLVFVTAGKPSYPQSATDKGIDNWGMMPLNSSELRTLIARSQLVAKATVLEHTTKSDHGVHIENTALRLDKVFWGAPISGQRIDLLCICSREYPGLVPGAEAVFFADHRDGTWEPSRASLTYEMFYLPSSSWLTSRIEERVPKVK